jgi:DNA (cytosine-5)-methyltransferase 1
MKYGSLFSGIGGFDRGFDLAGMDCAWQVEQDPACLRVLSHHWPDVTKLSDVRLVNEKTVQPVDLICGGFPCQDLSVAGKRAGLSGERSGLWHEFHRILAELRPGWCVIENVPGLLSSNGGRDFAVILRGLVELGYGVTWRVLDAQYFGVPQRRRRVFIVGSLGSGRSAEVLFEREGLFGDPPARSEAREGSTRKPAGCFGIDSEMNADPDRIGANESHQSGGSELFVARMAAFGEYVDDGTASSLKSRDFKDATDLVAAIAQSNRGNTTDGIAETLRADCNGALPMIAFSSKDHGADAGELAPTLRSMNYDQSHINGGGQVAVAFNLRGREGGAMPEESDVASVRSASGGSSRSYVAATAVRRLTPVECCRLQSLPDDWLGDESDSSK